MLMRINSLEKNINELLELKSTTRELCEVYTSIQFELYDLKPNGSSGRKDIRD